MSMRLEEGGKLGVGSNMIFDSYWPGGTRNTAWWKNVTGLLTEVASADIATPVSIEPGELRGGVKGLPEYERQLQLPLPLAGRLVAAARHRRVRAGRHARASWRPAAEYRESLLTNVYRMAREATERGAPEPPYAWIVPAGQRDPVAAALLVDLLLRHGVRVQRAAAPVTPAGRSTRRAPTSSPRRSPTGSSSSPCSARSATRRSIPFEGGPIMAPYDVTSWSLPIAMGVEVVEADAPVSGTASGRSAHPRAGLAGRRGAPRRPGGMADLPRAPTRPSPPSTGCSPTARRSGGWSDPVAGRSPRAGRATSISRPARRRRRSSAASRARLACRSGRSPQAPTGPAWRVQAGARRPLQALGGEHGRGLDPLPPGALRLPLREPEQRADEGAARTGARWTSSCCRRSARTSWRRASPARPRRAASGTRCRRPTPAASAGGRREAQEVGRGRRHAGGAGRVGRVRHRAPRAAGAQRPRPRSPTQDFHAPAPCCASGSTPSTR